MSEIRVVTKNVLGSFNMSLSQFVDIFSCKNVKHYWVEHGINVPPLRV